MRETDMDADRIARINADMRNATPDLSLRPAKIDPVKRVHATLDKASVGRMIGDALDGAETVPSDIRATLAERGSRYGDFTQLAMISQSIKANLRTGVSYTQIPIWQQEAIEMVVVKLARMVCGDPAYRDNFEDIQGYCQLVLDRLPKGDAK